MPAAPMTFGFYCHDTQTLALLHMSASQIQLRFQQDGAPNPLDDQLLERIDITRVQLPRCAQHDPDQRWRAGSYLDDTQVDLLTGKLYLAGRDLP